MAGIVLLAVSCAPSGDTAPPTPATPPPPPPVTSAPNAPRQGFEVAPGLPPLPVDGVAAAPRSVETVRAVFEFAAGHPEVLSYVPCFCGCESAGHRNNEHCFVGARDGQGKVTQWDYHGLT